MELPAIGTILMDTVDGSCFRVDSIDPGGRGMHPRIYTTGVEDWQGPHTIYLDELGDYTWSPEPSR